MTVKYTCIEVTAINRTKHTSRIWSLGPFLYGSTSTGNNIPAQCKTCSYCKRLLKKNS